MSGGPAAEATSADLRLVPPAFAAWLAALAVVHAPQVVSRAVPVLGAATVAATTLVLVAALGSVAPRARLPTCADPVVEAGRAGPAGRGRWWTHGLPAVALCVMTAVVVLLSGGVTLGLAPAALLGAVDDGRTVEVVGRVTSEPRAVPGDEARVVFTVMASAVRVQGTWRQVRTPVEVVAPRGATVDAVVRLRGDARPGLRGSRGQVLVRARQPPVVTAPPRPVHAWAGQVRRGASTVAAGLPTDVRGLLPAVTVGDDGDVPADLVAAMRTAGLAHVMAVSGAHFAMLGALVLALTAALGAPRPVRVAAAVGAGAALLLVVGPTPSVVRAAVMGAVGLAGLLAGRRAAGPAALASAVVALLVADPRLAVDVGFALSVAATAGLVVLGRPLVEAWAHRACREVAAVVAAPVAAQLGCLPVALALWPTLGPWAVVANVAVAPVVAPATILGLLAASLAAAAPSAAGAVATAAGAACWWIASVARAAAAMPGASLPWWPGAGGAVSATLVVVGAATLILRSSRAP